MAESKIEWTDYTFNPWIGCSKVSPGCANCYAERDFDQRKGRAKWGPNGSRSKTSADYWKQPLKWNKAAEAAEIEVCNHNHLIASDPNVALMDPPERPRVFCASLADVFEDWDGRIVNHEGAELAWCETDHRFIRPHGWCEGLEVGPVTMADLRRDLFALIDATPYLDWLLVTKRPENIIDMWPVAADGDYHYRHDGLDDLRPHRKNVWLLTSVENQETYDQRAHDLYHGCRDLVPVLGFSAEPMLGPIKLWHDFDGKKTRNWQDCFDWVICGGESGTNARPMHPDWARGLRDQCQAADVPFFFKQHGEWLPSANGNHLVCVMPDGSTAGTKRPGGQWMSRVGKKAAGRLLDGVEHSEFPSVEVAR